jgi:hypothetical protein
MAEKKQRYGARLEHEETAQSPFCRARALIVAFRPGLSHLQRRQPERQCKPAIPSDRRRCLRRGSVGQTVKRACCCEQGRCASEGRWRRIARARKELRNGSSKSECESTSVRSTNCGNGHLVQAFRGIARIPACLNLAIDCDPGNRHAAPTIPWSPAGTQSVQTDCGKLISSLAKMVSIVFRGTDMERMSAWIGARSPPQ